MPTYLVIVYFTSIVLVLIMGIFAFLQNYKSIQNRLFFVFTITQGLWVLFLFFGYFYIFSHTFDIAKSAFFVHLVYGTGFMIPPLISTFFYYFPRRTFKVSNILKYSYLPLNLIIALLASFSKYVHKAQIIENGDYVADEYGSLYLIYLLFLLINLIIAVIISIKKLRDLKGSERTSMLVPAIGCWLFIFATIISNAILPIFGIGSIGSFHLVRNSPLYSFFFIVPAFYSINKYRFLNISNKLLNFIRILTIILIFLLATFAAFLIINSIFPDISLEIILFLSSLAGFSFYLLIGHFLPVFEKESFREFRNNISTLISKINLCETPDQFEKLIDQIFLINLNFSNAKVFAIRNKETSKKKFISIYVQNQFTRLLEICKKCIITLKDNEMQLILGVKQKNKVFNELKKLDANFCMPLFAENKLIGFFILKKNDNHDFLDEEIKELYKIKKHLEVSLMNLLLQTNLQSEINLMKKIIDSKTKQLKDKVKEVKEVIKQQADFIAVSAHELRTPLSIALFQLEDVLENHTDINKNTAEELQIVDDSLVRLRSLVQKLFDVQQFELNKVELNPQPTEFLAFIKQLFHDFESIAQSKNFDFRLIYKVKSSLKLNIDTGLLTQVVNNLLNNASKFTNPEGRISLETYEEKDQVFVKVRDTGGGVPDSAKKRIFEKFKSGAGSNGIGLGLYLCRRIVELHKGRIWAEDTPGGGATFAISLNK